MLIIGVPDNIASVLLSPQPSFDAILTTTSEILYNAFKSYADIFSVENMILHSGASALYTALKSVPFSSTGSVCITNPTVSRNSGFNWDTKCLNANIKSPGCFLLIFLLFQNTIKSIPFASLTRCFIDNNAASSVGNGLNIL